MAENETTQAPTPRRKRGAFPRIPLKSALELVDAIQELGHGDPVRKVLAFQKIGRSPDSSASHSLVSAANTGYGLIKGGKNATHFELTTPGQRLAQAQGAARRRLAIALLVENEFFQSILERYTDRPLPVDEIAADYFQREHNLTASDSESCWETVKENLNDFGLLEEVAGKTLIAPINQSAGSEPAADTESPGAPASDAPLDGVGQQDGHGTGSIASAATPKLNGIGAQIAFNIQVVLPENGDAETYDRIFESISKHLLK